MQGINSYVSAEEFADQGKNEDKPVKYPGEEAVFLGSACFGGAGGKGKEYEEREKEEKAVLFHTRSFWE
jgi:hypothetical protein